jgi:hypothetical protein
MRTTTALATTVFGISLALGAGRARADDASGTYEIKIDEVPTNCEHPLKYPTSTTLKVDVKGTTMTLELDRTPTMIGPPPKGGKVNAKSKLGHTPVSGMDGTFSVGGRISSDGILGLVLNAEYQTTDKKLLCTQSWNLSGLKQDAKKGAGGGLGSGKQRKAS